MPNPQSTSITPPMSKREQQRKGQRGGGKADMGPRGRTVHEREGKQDAIEGPNRRAPRGEEKKKRMW